MSWIDREFVDGFSVDGMISLLRALNRPCECETHERTLCPHLNEDGQMMLALELQSDDLCYRHVPGQVYCHIPDCCEAPLDKWWLRALLREDDVA